MRMLVTGGAGFIGSHLVDALLARGHAVAVVDDLSSGRRENLAPAAEFVETDLASPESQALVARFRPDALAHLAAQIDVRASVVDPAHDAATNVLGSLSLFEACRRAGVSRWVFTSSGGAMHGDAERFPTPETEAPSPRSPYGCAKLAVEGYLGYYARVHGIRGCSLRLANVYGPRQDATGESGVVAIFARAYLSGKAPTIFGDGGQTRDYVHVKDVVAAFVAALEGGTVGTFNVGTGIETSTRTVSDLVRAAAGATVTAKHGPERAGDPPRSALDASAIARTLGWRPTVPLTDGLREVVEWFRERGPKGAPAR